jgi:ribosomal protein L35AE/L33A
LSTASAGLLARLSGLVGSVRARFARPLDAFRAGIGCAAAADALLHG